VAGLLAASVEPAVASPTLTITSARFGNVFVQGEPPVLSVTVTGEADAGFRGRLLVQVVDGYRSPAGRASSAISIDPGETTTRDITIRSRRLGHFTVVATVRNADGRTMARVETTAGIVSPIDQSDAEDSAVGYFVDVADGEVTRANEIASQMRRVGIRWVRLTFNWWRDGRLMRPDLGDPRWLDSSTFETWVDAFRANGIEVVGVFLGIARWASSPQDPSSALRGLPPWSLFPPRDLEDWKLFVQTLAGRLEGRIGTWEVWNEPSIVYFWQAGPSEFATLVLAAAEALRDVDPSIRVLVNLVEDGTQVGLPFADALVTDAGKAIDIFGFHYATGDARPFVPLLRPGAGIWNTEAFGAPRRQVSGWLAERAAGVQRIFPFIYHGTVDDSEWATTIRFGRYLVNLDYTPRADAIAVATLSRMVGSLPIVASAAAGLGYFAYTFEGPSGEVVALADGNEPGMTWSPASAVQLRVSVPAGVRRVTIIDLMGNSKVRRVRKGVLRLRLDGVAAFLVPEGGTSLAGMQVERADVIRSARALRDRAAVEFTTPAP